MRHRKDGRKLGRTASHRKAMLANMAANLFLHKQIQTTHPKALEARRLAESLITKAKKGDLHSRRMVLRVIPQRDIVKILFEEIAPQYANRNGGYTRITKLGQRKNDAAAVSLLSLVDYDPSGQVSTEPVKEKKTKAAPVADKATAEADVVEEVVESAETATEEVVEVAEEEVAEAQDEAAEETKDAEEEAPEEEAPASDEDAEPKAEKS